MDDAPESFVDRYMPVTETGCWIWTGSINSRTGYGYYQSKDGAVTAHRFSYMLHRGNIPANQIICHTCDVRNCVNPDHLFLGSYSDNTQDMLAKNRDNYAKGESHVRAHLSEEAVRAIRNSTEFSRVLAERYGVGRQAIDKVRNGISWKHVI